MARKPISERISPKARGSRRRHSVVVVVFDGVVLGDVATPIELFERAVVKDRPHYDVRICSAAREVTSRHLTLRIGHRLSALEEADTVVIPGLDDLDRAIPAKVIAAIRRAGARGARLASICTGAFVLAATGALDGLRATTHWRAANELASRHPLVDVDPGVLYVDNGRVLTSAGAAAAFDLCLHMIRRDLGAAAAAEVARAAVMPLEREGGQSQFIVHRPPADDGGTLRKLVRWMERNLADDLSLVAMARRGAVSTRTLSRRFGEEMGTTPAAWVAKARVRRAQWMLETTRLAVERIATEVGFRSATVLRQHFASIVGTSPLAYRKSFGRL